MDNFKETSKFNILKYRGWNISKRSEFHYAGWNEEKNKWQHKWVTEYLDRTQRDFFEFDNQRTNGVFMILKCLNAEDKQFGSEIHEALNILCDPTIDKYIPVEPDWNPGWMNPIFRTDGFGAKFGASHENENHNFVFQDEHVVFDGRPNFYISYTNFVDLNKKTTYPEDKKFEQAIIGYEISDELEDLYIKRNPHHCARTLGELFRLIIDWDLAYHYFDNREEIAVICHKIMGSIEMPADIYEALIKNIPDSVVVRYIKNDPNALELGDRPKTPDIAIEWFKNKYWDLRHTVFDEYDNTGTAIEDHYYRKEFGAY